MSNPSAGQFPPEQPATNSSPHMAMLWVVVVVAFTTAFGASYLVDAASNLPFGTKRTMLLNAAEAIEAQTSRYWLGQPMQQLEHALSPAEADSRDRTVTSATREVAAAPPSPTATVQPPHTPPVTQTEPLALFAATHVPEALNDALPPSSHETLTTHSADASPLLPAAPAVSGAEGTASTQPLAHANSRPVSPEAPLVVWAGGDSLGEYVGGQLLYQNTPGYPADVTLDYHISTGLARPDFFDWPRRLADANGLVPRPEAFVFMVGGNDDQNMSTIGADGTTTVYEFASPLWRAEYRRRVATIMDATQSDSSHLFWIGLPPMRDDQRSVLASAVNQAVATEASQRPWVTFVDIEDLFLDESGAYARRLENPDGDLTTVRAPDGVHVTAAGSEWITAVIWDHLAERWPTAATANPPHEKHELGGEPPSWPEPTQ